MIATADQEVLIYAPPHYIGNMGDRIVTKILNNQFPQATFIYDNYFNFVFGNRTAKKKYLNPRNRKSTKKFALFSGEFSKFILFGMDGVDGYYSLRESKFKIELASSIAQAGGASWIMNFSWNNSTIDSSLLSALNDAQVAGVKFVARDSKSCKRLDAHGIKARVCSDLGFLITENRKISNIDSRAGRVQKKDFAILAPSYTFGKHRRQIIGFAEMAISLRSQGITPVLFASVTNLRKSDVVLAKRINRQVVRLEGASMPIYRDEQSLTEILGQSCVVISGRMHVAIVALAHLIPPFVLEYQGKSSGMLSDVGLKTLVSENMDISNIDIQNFIKNSSEYSEILGSRIPIMKNEISNLLNEIINSVGAKVKD